MKSDTGASAAEAVKGLRCAPMNSANYKTVRSALDCLPRCGLRSRHELLTQLRNESFLLLIGSRRTTLNEAKLIVEIETVSACSHLVAAFFVGQAEPLNAY